MLALIVNASSVDFRKCGRWVRRWPREMVSEYSECRAMRSTRKVLRRCRWTSQCPSGDELCCPIMPGGAQLFASAGNEPRMGVDSFAVYDFAAVLWATHCEQGAQIGCDTPQWAPSPPSHHLLISCYCTLNVGKLRWGGKCGVYVRLSYRALQCGVSHFMTDCGRMLVRFIDRHIFLYKCVCVCECCVRKFLADIRCEWVVWKLCI